MFCEKCGNELSEQAAFCSRCGAPVRAGQVHTEPSVNEQPNEASFESQTKQAKQTLQNKAVPVSAVIAIGAGALVVIIAIVLAIVLAATNYKKTGSNSQTVVLQNEAGQTKENASSDDNTAQKDTALQESEAGDAKEPDGNAGMNDLGASKASEEDWKAAYASYYNGMDAQMKDSYVAAGFIYVNEDDVPEVVFEGNCEAVGYLLLTYKDGQVDELFTSRLCFDYIEKQNLLRNGGGHMGYYYDVIYSIKDGKWNQVVAGEYGGDGDESTYTYNWDGDDVNETDYVSRLNSVYDTEAAIWPNGLMSFPDFESYVTEGQVLGANHRYEFIVADVTWYEAYESCVQKGGYLATITSEDEMQKITDQMLSEGKEKMTFWVGATRDRQMGGYDYYWAHEGEKDISMLMGACWDFWLPGEPSYNGEDAHGNEIEEMYVDLFYRSADGRCYLNDVDNDIIAQAPGYKGKIGFICEYDK